MPALQVSHLCLHSLLTPWPLILLAHAQVWPSDPKAIARCKRRVFQLHREGRLQAWVDRSAHFKGLDSIPDAVEHMLRGGHMGKVVVEI